MANENTPGLAPAHLSSQHVPGGNSTASTPYEKQVLELQRREKELRKQQEALKGSVSFDSLKERAKSDRAGLLRELGLDDLITEDSNDPLTALKKQMDAMRNEQLEKDRAAQEDRDFESLTSQLRSKSDDYELITKLGSERQVFEAMKRYKAEHGEMPDAFEIAKQLEDATYGQLNALKGSKKLSELFKSESTPSTPRHPLDQSSTMTSNDRTSTSQAEPASPTMSRQQMIEAASKHIKFNDN